MRCFISIYEDPNILPTNLRLERVNNWHDILFDIHIWLNFELKLVFLNLHSFDLILVPQKHNLRTLIDCLEKFNRLYIKLLLLIRNILLHNFIFNSSNHNFGISHDTIKRSHLFMTIVCLYGIQIYLIKNFLLIY